MSSLSSFYLSSSFWVRKYKQNPPPLLHNIVNVAMQISQIRQTIASPSATDSRTTEPAATTQHKTRITTVHAGAPFLVKHLNPLVMPQSVTLHP